jgi:hypothetical protein
MDPSNLRQGEKIAVGAAVVLFIDMFLSWYGVNFGDSIANQLVKASGADTTVTAWQAFDWVDILLVLAIGGTIAIALTQSGSGGMTIAGIGAVATFFVAYRILNQPGPNDVVDVKFGAWLGLLLCIAIMVGGYRASQEEGVPGPPPVPAAP